MPFDHRSLLSGQQRGVIASAMRGSLWLGSGAYSAAARVRRWQYDTGRKEIHHADVPVISVGNLTTGGTGKTPVVCNLCRRIRGLGRRVVIISRGYGAGDSGINDEAMELQERLPDVPHVQHPDRVEAARIAVEELEAEILVMDDGFQHRRLRRDLDLLVIDATSPFGFGYMLPRGYLREPISSVSRADMVIITRVDQVETAVISQIKQTLEHQQNGLPIFETTHQPSTVSFQDGSSKPIDTLKSANVALVSAIGNPKAFERTVRGCGANVIGHYAFPDHDAYDRDARNAIQNWVLELRSNPGKPPPAWLLCTHKDAVKLATDSISGVPLGHIQIELKWRTPDADLQAQIAELCAGSS